MANAAFLISIAALALFSTFFFSLPLAGIAVLLAALSGGDNGTRVTRANLAIVLGVISIVLCYATLFSTMWLLLNSKELQDQLAPSFEQLYGVPIEDALSSIREGLGLSR